MEKEIDIICFIVTQILVAISCWLLIKKKPPEWKFLLGYEAFMEIVVVLFLICRINAWQ